jgi:hypothetical protein
MAKIQLNQRERDLLATLAEAAAESQFHGSRPLVECVRELTRDDFPILQALAGRLTVPEDPPSHEMKLNW